MSATIHVPSDEALQMKARRVDVGPITPAARPSTLPYHSQFVNDGAEAAQSHTIAKAYDTLAQAIPGDAVGTAFKGALMDMMLPANMRSANMTEILKTQEKAVAPINAIAKAFRSETRKYQSGQHKLPTAKSFVDAGAISKAVLDVGSNTNFATITGGQSLGYVSMDTRIARGTVRPDSFTLYQALAKSAAFQIVDYWTYLDDPGGPIAGAAFTGFSNVQSGTLTTDIGSYSLQNVLLKLGLDGRAMTLALAAQNSFQDVAVQENANAALTVLGSMNWASYYGNTTLYPNQPVGLGSSIPTANIFDFQQFYKNNATLQGWSIPQALYNMIYEVAAQITSWGTYGRISHAFMTPVTNGSLQGLVTTTLNNIVTTLTNEQRMMPGIVVDGDLQGMRTRMGVIQFPLDISISARDKAAQAQTRANGTNYATTTAPTPPTGVVAAISGAAYTGASNWGLTGYAVSASGYSYAVASTDINSNESVLAFTPTVTGIAATGAYVLTIAPPGDVSAINFRIYRSGLGGYSAASGSATAYRWIGTVAASGSSNVTFVDANLHIPGSESIFLLDMYEEDFALDYRFLLPLTKVELFAQNLYMPWAVCTIGAIRNRIPKFHGIITNYVPDNPSWNPLGPNA